MKNLFNEQIKAAVSPSKIKPPKLKDQVQLENKEPKDEGYPESQADTVPSSAAGGVYKDPRFVHLDFVLDEGYRPLVVYQECGKPLAVLANSKLGCGLIRTAMGGTSTTPVKRTDINETIESIEELLEANHMPSTVPYRIAALGDGSVVVDATDSRGTRYHIKSSGVFANTKVANDLIFARASTAEPIYCSEAGSLKTLGDYLNVGERQLWLLIAWLAYTVSTPKMQGKKFVHLILNGPEGSGKSFASMVLASFVDPHSTRASAFPSDKKSLAIALAQTHVAVFDNMRTINAQSSDLLAQASSRATVSDRRLYTDSEQHIITLHAACIMNGIYDISKYPDFIQRSLAIQMSPLNMNGYTSGASLQEKFQKDRPALQLGDL